MHVSAFVCHSCATSLHTSLPWHPAFSLFLPSSEIFSPFPVVQCLAFTNLLFPLAPFITNCTDAHREKAGESLIVRPFGSSISEHKAIGLVLLGVKSFNVLIGTEEGRVWLELCLCVDLCICECLVQVFTFGSPGFENKWRVNTTSCIWCSIPWAPFNKLFHSYTHWITEGG